MVTQKLFKQVLRIQHHSTFKMIKILISS